MGGMVGMAMQGAAEGGCKPLCHVGVNVEERG